MSILIKDMKMPNDCDSCKIGDLINCTLWKPMDIGERHSDCPLREVKEPHGRLIDENDLYDKMYQPFNERLGQYEPFLVINESDIEEAPTIIPKEWG